MDIVTYFRQYLARFLLFPLIIIRGAELSESGSLRLSIFPKISVLSLPKIKNKLKISSGNRWFLPFRSYHLSVVIYCALFMHPGDLIEKIARAPSWSSAQNGVWLSCSAVLWQVMSVKRSGLDPEHHFWMFLLGGPQNKAWLTRSAVLCRLCVSCEDSREKSPWLGIPHAVYIHHVKAYN